MASLTFIVNEAQAGKTLKQAVFAVLKPSRHLFSSAKFRGGLKVDGVAARADQRVREGQIVSLILKEDAPSGRLPQAEPLDIAYEDGDLMVVVKPAPLPSQASGRQGTDTLENRVAAWWKQKEPFVYRPVNRLDKGVSGLMVIAKNAYAQYRLQSQFHTPGFVREYLAVVEGAPDPLYGTIDAPIAKVSAGGVKRCVAPEGKPSVTHYETLRRANGRSLVALRLGTGRTHQIRVHLQSIGCPAVGDFLYGRETAELPGRLALHAWRLILRQPMTGSEIQLTSPLPGELKRLMDTKETCEAAHEAEE